MMADLYRIDGPTTADVRVEYHRKPGETTYAIHVFHRAGGRWEESADLSEHRYGPAKVEESIEMARANGFIVTTPYDDDLRHEQNH